MVAPIDAKVALDLGDEQIVLRLDMRALAMCEQLGVDLFAEGGIPTTMHTIACAVKGLSATEHPDMTADEALAIVVQLKPLPVVRKIVELIALFGAKASDGNDAEGNVPVAKKAAKRGTARASTTSSPTGANKGSTRTRSGTKRRAASI